MQVVYSEDIQSIFSLLLGKRNYYSKKYPIPIMLLFYKVECGQFFKKLTLWPGLLDLVVSPDVSGNINPARFKVGSLKMHMESQKCVEPLWHIGATDLHVIRKQYIKLVMGYQRNVRSVWSLVCRCSVKFEIAAKSQVLSENPELSFFVLSVQFSCRLLPHLLTVFIPLLHP